MRYLKKYDTVYLLKFFQFIIRTDQLGVLDVTDVGLDTVQDDPNFGDATLFL